MTPGTRVRIHYPGRPYHGVSGTVAKLRRPGRTYNQYTVDFDAPVYFGDIRIERQAFTRGRLRPLKDEPTPAHKPACDNVVVWRDGMPQPRRARFVAGDAEPVLVAVNGWRVVGGGE